MADYIKSFEPMIIREGGYRLHKIPGDRGGLTYAGISRVKNPHWTGWKIIDSGHMDDLNLAGLVREFYYQEYWERINGDLIADDMIAGNIFDFAVNAGVRTASILVQVTVNATPDGILGPVSLGKLNAIDVELFLARYGLSKIGRYLSICKKDPSQGKFLRGWISRTLEAL